MSADPNHIYLADAREWLQANLPTGVTCPCCDQHAQVYRRSIHATMAAALCLTYRHFKLHPLHPWVHLGQLLAATKQDSTIAGGDAVKLKYWELIREAGGTPGRYTITARGRDFVEGNIAVPKYALIYNQELLKLDGPAIFIRDALGPKFDYTQLTGRT